MITFDTTQTISFGKYQDLASTKMKKYPILSKLIKSIFGYTVLSNYSRFKVFQDAIKPLDSSSFIEILDIGSGYGEYSFYMAEYLKNASVTSVDINKEAIEIIQNIKDEKKIHNLKALHGDINKIHFGNKFDFIFSIDVFEHLPLDQMPFKKSYDLLNKGGYLLVKMPSKKQNTIFPDSWFKDHQKWLDHEHPGQVLELNDLKNKFRSSGFKVLWGIYTDYKIARLAWELDYLCRKAGPALQLALLPLLKGMVNLDHLFTYQQANAMIVMGKKL